MNFSTKIIKTFDFTRTLALSQKASVSVVRNEPIIYHKIRHNLCRFTSKQENLMEIFTLFKDNSIRRAEKIQTTQRKCQ